MNLKWVADHFDKMQYALLGLILFVAWRGLRSNQEQTGFKAREADRTDLDRLKKNDGDLANAKMHRKQPSAPLLSLPGIRLSGEAYEILGVEANAREPEIMRAYKEKIKLFHPDRIQGQAREQIKFYEEASAKINQAKEEMLARFKK
jgi:DnaJ-domain-containing protein 1